MRNINEYVSCKILIFSHASFVTTIFYKEFNIANYVTYYIVIYAHSDTVEI